MLKSFLSSSLLFLSIQINAQYEQGYIVTKDGTNKIGYVQNENWRENPETIRFKENQDSSASSYDTKTISEFGIGDKIKFLAETVVIDISSDKMSRLGRTKEPIFEEKTLFLKKLVDGQISLYQYSSGNGTKFFVQKDYKFEQLIFKRYYATANTVAENEYYKQQLVLIFADAKAITRKRIVNIDYSAKSISKIISEYNLLKNQSSVTYIQQNKWKPKLKVIINGGFEQTSVSYQFRNVATLNPSFPDISRTLFGADLELLILKERIGLFSGFAIKSGVSETIDLQTSIPDLTQETSLSYNNNTLSIGIRGYIPTIKNLNLILTAGITTEYISDFSISLEISQVDENFNRNAGTNFIGFGLAYKRIFTEVRFFNNKMFAENVSNSVDVDNSNMNFRLGYKIF